MVLAVLAFSGPAFAQTMPTVEAGLAIRASKMAVKETIDAIAKSAEEKGARIAARVDHAAGAKAIGAELRPNQLLIFGNPRIGTPMMQGNARAGLDLPLKVLAYEDAAGKTWVVYQTPASIGVRYGLGATEQAALTAGANAIEAILAGAGISP
jgi:uncharacterized protein (DUF302 family)